MANTYKVLGQVAPTDTNNANLYTVPSGTAAVTSSLHVVNVTDTSVTCRIYVRVGGAAAAAGNAIAYDATIAAKSMFVMTNGMTLAASDVVTVSSDTSNALTFTLFGSEVN